MKYTTNQLYTVLDHQTMEKFDFRITRYHRGDEIDIEFYAEGVTQRERLPLKGFIATIGNADYTVVKKDAFPEELFTL